MNLKPPLLFLLVTTVGACTHPLDIIGEGDIISQSGNRDCTLEDSLLKGDDQPCDIVVFDTDYIETYTAQARPGWQFDRWIGCGDVCETALEIDEDGNQCSFNVPKSSVESSYGARQGELIAIFSPTTNNVIHEMKWDSGQTLLDAWCIDYQMSGPGDGNGGYLLGSHSANHNNYNQNYPSNCVANSLSGYSWDVLSSETGGPPSPVAGNGFLKLYRHADDPSALPNSSGNRTELTTATKFDFNVAGTYTLEGSTSNADEIWFSQYMWVPLGDEYVAPSIPISPANGGHYIWQLHGEETVPMKLDLRERALELTIQQYGLPPNPNQPVSVTNKPPWEGLLSFKVMDDFPRDRWVELKIRVKIGHTDGEVDLWIDGDKRVEFRAGQAMDHGPDSASPNPLQFADWKAGSAANDRNIDFSWSGDSEIYMKTGSYMNGAAPETTRTIYLDELRIATGPLSTTPSAGTSGNSSTSCNTSTPTYGALLASEEESFSGKSSPFVTFDAPNAGDLLVAYMVAGENRTLLAPTSGWTEVDTFTGNRHLAGMWYKVSNGTETKFTANFSSNVWGALKFERYDATGLNTGAALTDSNLSAGNSAGTKNISLGNNGNGVSGLAIGFVGADGYSGIDAGAAFTDVFDNPIPYQYTGPMGVGLVTTFENVSSSDQLTSNYSTTDWGDEMVGMLLVMPEQ